MAPLMSRVKVVVRVKRLVNGGSIVEGLFARSRYVHRSVGKLTFSLIRWVITTW